MNPEIVARTLHSRPGRSLPRRWVAAATPVLAQSTVEAVTETGRYGPLPDNIRSISQTVSFADLDLGSTDGRHELKHRIITAAIFATSSANRIPPTPWFRPVATRPRGMRTPRPTP